MAGVFDSQVGLFDNKLGLFNDGGVDTLGSVSFTSGTPSISTVGLSEVSFLSAVNINTSPSVISTATIVQSHDLSPVGIDALPVVISSATVVQSHDLSPVDIETLPAVISTVTIVQSHDLSPVDIDALPVVISTATIVQSHDLSPVGIDALPVVISSATTVQSHDLSSVSISTEDVVISSSTITQTHVLNATITITGVPLISEVTLDQVQSIAVDSTLTGVPEVNPTPITQNNNLGADNILTGRPDVEDATDPNVIYEQVVQQMFGGWPRRIYDHTDLAIARGHTTGYTPIYKFGYNPDVDSAEETVWSQGGNYPWLDVAVTMFVSSSSANDTNGGTGANTILIQGLDEDYNEIEETITLNGQTQVTTQLSYLRVYRAYVTLAGSSGTSGGTVYVGSSGASGGVPNGTTYATIAQGNQTQIAAYTVPAGHTLYLDDINFTAAVSQQNRIVTCSFHSRDFGTNVFRTRFINVIQSNQLITKFEYPQPFAERTDIECRVSTNTTNTAIGASFQGVLIKNDS